MDGQTAAHGPFVSEAVREHEAIDVAKQRRQHAVQAALDAGVSATVLADAMGLSRGRVYQIRDGL